MSQTFRTAHITLVADYIMAQQKKSSSEHQRTPGSCGGGVGDAAHSVRGSGVNAVPVEHSSEVPKKKVNIPTKCPFAMALAGKNNQVDMGVTGSSIGGLEDSAGGKGTGGTELMSFLKPIRDNCGERFECSLSIQFVLFVTINENYF